MATSSTSSKRPARVAEPQAPPASSSVIPPPEGPEVPVPGFASSTRIGRPLDPRPEYQAENATPYSELLDSEGASGNGSPDDSIPTIPNLNGGSSRASSSKPEPPAKLVEQFAEMLGVVLSLPMMLLNKWRAPNSILWLPLPGSSNEEHARAIAGAAARIAARRIPVDGDAKPADVVDLLDAGVHAVAYGIENLQAEIALTNAVPDMPPPSEPSFVGA